MMKLIFSFLLLTFSISTYANNGIIDGETGLIGVISFDYDKSNLDQKDKTTLLKLINSFSTNNIIINGFTDSDGDLAYNKALSKRRAESVKQFLIKNGYPSSKIVATNANGEVQGGVKAFNRKVEINLDVETVPPPKIVTKDLESQQETVEDKVKSSVSLKDEFSVLEIGQTLAIKNLNFIPGRHVLLPDSEPTLKELLQILNDNPTLKIEIQGHICCTPSGGDGMDQDTHTMNLSINRAQYVYNYLIENNISPYRLSFKGFGASKPLVEEITEADRIKNRRVEIMIVEK